jgi:hypothetical protein
MESYSGSGLEIFHKIKQNESDGSFRDYTHAGTSSSAIAIEVYNSALIDKRNLELVNANLIKQLTQQTMEIVSFGFLTSVKQLL